MPPPTPSQKKPTHTQVLPSYDRVSYKFNETPLLAKVPPGMSLPLKVPKLNERPQTKYHNFNTLLGVKCLKYHVQHISKDHKKSKITEENQ